jgi:transposase
MELITILNRCHRFRGFVYQHAHFSADKMSIEVTVRPRKGSAAVCSRCHLPAPGYDQLTERRFEFIPLWGFLVYLLYTMRRVDCRRCGVVAVEEVPWGDGKRTLTKAYMLFLASWARRLSWKETAEAFRTSWDKVFDAVEHVVTWGLEHRTLGQIDAIGVDEIQYSKGHKYLTLVYQIDLGVTRLLGRQRKNDRVLSRILHHHRGRNHIKDRVHLLRYVGALPKGHSRQMLRSAAHSRSVPHRSKNE